MHATRSASALNPASSSRISYIRAARLSSTLLAPLLFAACADDGSFDPPALASGTTAEAVVIGSLEWASTTTLAPESAARGNASAVGLLNLPAVGARCTAFLIAPDVVMTNNHCVSSAGGAGGATVSFAYEDGSSDPLTFDCSTFIGSDPSLDYGLLRCTGAPGNFAHTVELEPATPVAGEGIYVVQQNCDYYANASCAPTKKLASGKVTSPRASSIELSHDADTLGGSSGSPVFSTTSNRVIAIHHAGLGQGVDGRGTSNLAVLMKHIVPAIRARFPTVALGGSVIVNPSDPPVVVLPPPTTPPNDQAGPGVVDVEPNETSATAFAIDPRTTLAGLAIESADDVDWFAFLPGAQARTVRIDFDHSAGDLDLYVYGPSGAQVASSIGQLDEEVVSRTYRAGTYRIRVVGYAGGTDTYTLTIE